MSGFRIPLALSLAAHAILLALLLLIPAPAPPTEPPLSAGGIEIAFAPSLPEPATPPAPPPVKAATSPPPPPVAAPPPPPPPAPEAPATVSEPPPPPPPPKPSVPPLPERMPRRVERRQPNPVYAPPAPPITPAPAALPRTAFAPPAPVHAPALAPSTAIGPGYRALLSEWLETHKRYPESARQQDEEGRAILRFVVERSGRVAQFAVVKSTGYPDLDAALEDMMRGATLPPFPPDMDEPSIEVSVAIRFSLGR